MSADTQVQNGIDILALDSTKAAVKNKPSLAAVTFSLDSKWVEGCYQSAKTGAIVQDGEVVTNRTSRFTMRSDEPAALLGTDKAASPGEYILQALAGCYAVTYAVNAAARGIALDRLEFDLEIDFDLQGFLGVDKTVDPGAREIRVAVRAESSTASREDLEALTETVQQRSPIHDTLSRDVQVVTTLK